VSAAQCLELEKLAKRKNLTLCQSTLERHNPLAKFFKQNFKIQDISYIKSYRYGLRPSGGSESDAKFDLGIHDVDLWSHLTNRQTPWHVYAGYSDRATREIHVVFKDGRTVILDLLNKTIVMPDGTMLDFNESSQNNPMLEMIYDIIFHKSDKNEQWHKEIDLIEQQTQIPLMLDQDSAFNYRRRHKEEIYG
jgi:predicted dehydrogenase